MSTYPIEGRYEADPEYNQKADPRIFDTIVNFVVTNDTFTLGSLCATIDLDFPGSGRHVRELFNNLQPYIAGWLQRNVNTDMYWYEEDGTYGLDLDNTQREVYLLNTLPYEYPGQLVNWRQEVGTVAMKRLMWHSASDGLDIEKLLSWMDNGSYNEAERLRIIEDLARLEFITATPKDETVILKIADQYSPTVRPYDNTFALTEFALAITS